MGHRRRQETLYLAWVTAGTGLLGKRGKGTHDDQACGSEQAASLAPGSWPHKNNVILIYPRVQWIPPVRGTGFPA